MGFLIFNKAFEKLQRFITFLYTYIIGARFYKTDVKIPGESFKYLYTTFNDGSLIRFKFYKHHVSYYRYRMGIISLREGVLYAVEPEIDLATHPNAERFLGVQMYIRDHYLLIADDENIASLLMRAYTDYMHLEYSL